jgi:glycosyltransferase involved in cell wall biosynthesis
LRILIVTYSIEYGGVETSILKIATIYQSAGHEVILVESSAKRNILHNYQGFKVVSYPINNWSIPILHALKISQIYKGADLILIFDSPLAQAAVGKSSVDTLIFPQIRCDLENMFYTAQSNFPNWDSIITISEKIRTNFLQLYPEYSKFVQIIPNGYIVPKERKVEYSKDRKHRFAYIGRLEKELKGILHLPKIFENIWQVNHNVTFTIIGSGPDELELKQIFEESPINSLVIWLPFLPAVSLEKEFHNTDFLIFPSTSEGFGNIVPEAMLNKVIPIASRLNGITDTYIIDSYNGFLATPGDPASFKDAYVRAFSLIDKLSNISQMGYETIRSKFSFELMSKNYLALLTYQKTHRQKSHKISLEILRYYYHFPFLPIIIGKIVNKGRKIVSLAIKHTFSTS